MSTTAGAALSERLKTFFICVRDGKMSERWNNTEPVLPHSSTSFSGSMAGRRRQSGQVFVSASHVLRTLYHYGSNHDIYCVSNGFPLFLLAFQIIKTIVRNWSCVSNEVSKLILYSILDSAWLLSDISCSFRVPLSKNYSDVLFVSDMKISSPLQPSFIA